MIYLDHGLGRAFSSYDDYFGGNMDRDAVTYLQLANELAHTVKPGRDHHRRGSLAAWPGMARPVDEGGIGFDYRLAMGVPDYWIKILKEKRDEEWDLGEICPHAAEPPPRREAHRLRREPRPGAGGRQDAGVLADGPGDVLAHGHGRARTWSSTAASRCTR